jgi:ABC-type transport system involved in cytochrome bd biosynthesis fused ATPase/permease subunit
LDRFRRDAGHTDEELARCAHDGVSFHIREGEKVAIVGATGAGKTSIISLVSRFYDVQKGHNWSSLFIPTTSFFTIFLLSISCCQ